MAIRSGGSEGNISLIWHNPSTPVVHAPPVRYAPGGQDNHKKELE